MADLLGGADILSLDVKGMKALVKRIERLSNVMVKRAEENLIDAGQFLQTESQKICPVQTGVLHASAFTRKAGKNHIIVGYLALYAAYVHENPNAAHGRAFNIKHAVEISRANERLRFNAEGRVIGQKAGTRRSRVWFNRGERQQFKFLEKPARDKRREILRIVGQGII